MAKLEEGVLKKVKKFFKKHGNKGKFEKASVRAMQAPTASGWANRQKRINALKENEQLDEISKKTLGSYVKKASNFQRKADDNLVSGNEKDIDSADRKYQNKNIGIKRANKKLKEEFNSEEFIDFLLAEGHSEEEIEAFLDEGFEEFLTEEVVEEGVMTTIKNKLSGKREDTVTKAMRGALRTGAKSIKYNSVSVSSANKSVDASLKGNKISAKDHYEQSVKAGRLGDGFLAANKSLTRKMHDLSVGKNYFKGKKVNEELDTEGLTEENLTEIKMKLKPGQKMSSKQFAKMKADVLAKQKAKAEKKAAPKVEPKPEVIENDDNNRGARILKGQFPWGRVTPELAKTALAKLKMIEKPADRLAAMNHIWDKQAHFHSLIKTGKINAPAKKEESPKSKITLPKVRGVND